MAKYGYVWTARKLGKTWRLELIVGKETKKGVEKKFELQKIFRNKIPKEYMMMMEKVFGFKKYGV